MPNREKHIAKQFRQVIAHTLAFELRDPNLSCVTVTEVEVTPDLQFADVRVTFGGENQTKAMGHLVKASGALRKALAQAIRMKRVPELRFHVDRTIETHTRIDEVLRGLVIPPETPEADQETHET